MMKTFMVRKKLTLFRSPEAQLGLWPIMCFDGSALQGQVLAFR